MIASSFVYRLALAVIAWFALGENFRLHAQNAHLPEPIRLALVRYTDLDPLAITWTQTTEATELGREKIAADVLVSILSDGRYVQQLALSDGRIYERRETEGNSAWPPRTEEIAFDRNLLCTARNLFYAGFWGSSDLTDQPYLHKWLPKNDQPQASYFRDDYLRAAGVRLPTRVKDLVSSWRPQSELLALLTEGGVVDSVGPTQLDRCSLIRVQVMTGKRPDGLSSPRRYDFFLVPERGHAVRRLEIRDDAGHLLTRCDCTEFVQLMGRSLWIPRLCQVEEYALRREPNEEKASPNIFTSSLCVKKIRVTAIDDQPWPEDRFQLKSTTPGTYVNDASFPEMKLKDGVFYQVPANPHRLDEVIAVRQTFHQAWLSVNRRARPLRALFLVLNSVGLAFYLIVRRRRKARST
jgi:hypothetical protein